MIEETGGLGDRETGREGGGRAGEQTNRQTTQVVRSAFDVENSVGIPGFERRSRSGDTIA